MCVAVGTASSDAASSDAVAQSNIPSSVEGSIFSFSSGAQAHDEATQELPKAAKRLKHGHVEHDHGDVHVGAADVARLEARFGPPLEFDSPVSSDLFTHNLRMPSFLSEGHFDPLKLAAAEKFAWTLLSGPRISASDLRTLFTLLPHEASPRGEKGVSFGSGAYVHGGVVGLRANTKEFPLSTMCLSLWLRHVQPGFKFTSCMVLHECQAALHRDLQNSPLVNIIVPLSSFSGGTLWVEGEGCEKQKFGGTDIEGGPVPWKDGAIVLHAAERAHCVLPWSGTRTVLVGFNVRFSEKLSISSKRLLVSLGFPIGCSSLRNLELPKQQSLLEDATIAATTHAPQTPLPVAQETVSATTHAPQTPKPVFIELCAGSALLSATARERGYSIMPIDWAGNKHRSFAHVVQLDLRKASTWSFVERILECRRVIWMHVAPPCGTASRAREIGRGPKPLRSLLHPWGLPSLAADDQARVDSANEIYRRTATFCASLQKRSPITGFTIENPLHSWMWSLPPFQDLMQHNHLVSFDACRHGSSRNKATALLTNVSCVGELSGPCPGCASHAPWGRTASGYATASEAAYPRLLCERILACVDVHATAKDVLPQRVATTPLAEARAATQKQPRGRKFAPLISEFAYTVSVHASSEPPVDSKNCLSHDWQCVPRGSKLLRVSVERGGQDTRAAATDQPCDDSSRFFMFGVYRSPEAFLREASLLQHPFDVARALPDGMMKALYTVLVDGPVAVVRTRLEKLKLWNTWAKELEPAETRLKANMPTSVRQVLKGKRTLLLQKIADSLNWPDKDLHKDLTQGFKLTGYLDHTGVFQPDEKPAYSTEQDFWDAAAVLRDSLWDKVANQSDQDYSQALWDLTMEESDQQGKGWLVGPLSRSQLDAMFPEGWSPCRRFAVWQGKWRPIDDFSECGVNACFGCFERISLKALDEITWACVQILRCSAARGDVSFTLHDGTVLRGKVHSAWGDAERIKPLSKTYDLKSAYKQMALHPSERSKAVIILREPASHEVKAFVCNTLPFGSSASVLHFNRVSLLLQRIMWELCLISACYYDDFPSVMPAMLSAGSDKIVHTVMQLLGYDMAVEKETSFSSASEMLGVVLDSGDSSAVRLRNRPDKSESMCESLGKILEAKSVSSRELPSMLGRLQFLESQLFGRMGKLALADLRQVERSSLPVVHLDDAHLDALKLLRSRLLQGRPRQIVVSAAARPVLLFTDGACEPAGDTFVTTIGGVLIVPGQLPRVFGSHVPDRLVCQWAERSKHVIGQTELYAVLIARTLWADHLNDSRCIAFVDHTGVHSACINGSSSDKAWRALLMHLEAADEEKPSLMWYHRVPSASNCADAPSRGQWDELAFLGRWERDHPLCPVTSELLKDL